MIDIINDVSTAYRVETIAVSNCEIFIIPSKGNNLPASRVYLVHNNGLVTSHRVYHNEINEDITTEFICRLRRRASMDCLQLSPTTLQKIREIIHREPTYSVPVTIAYPKNFHFRVQKIDNNWEILSVVDTSGKEYSTEKIVEYMYDVDWANLDRIVNRAVSIQAISNELQEIIK